MECVSCFAVPVIVKVALTGAVAAAAVSVIVLAAEVLTGLKEAVTPCGRLEALSVTGPSKLPRGIVTILVVALRPWGMDMLTEDYVSVKLLGPPFAEGRTS